jgi:Na+-translocating ferredoxin:NAD+ oxidoreductase RnfC subunit
VVTVHPIYDGRHVPLGGLMRKLGIERYNVPAPFADVPLSSRTLRFPLGRGTHRALVRAGERVRRGQRIAEHAGTAPGAHIHASLDGVVRHAGETIVIDRLAERKGKND